MRVGVDETGQDDLPPCIDHFRTPRLQLAVEAMTVTPPCDHATAAPEDLIR